jgi:type III restriction enzyme
MQQGLTRRPNLPPLMIPQLKMAAVKSEFSLADITDHEPFRHLGESIAADPLGQLRRVTLSARIVEGADGLRHTELVTAQAVDRVESPATLFPLDELRQRLMAQVLGAGIVPARVNEQRPAGEIVDAFTRGLGTQAEKILSGYMDRAAAGLIQLITHEHRRFTAKPSYGEVVALSQFNAVRVARLETSQDRFSAFKKGVGYEGYEKSLYAQDWFDSAPERDVANILEDEDAIVLWVRLQIGDLPILWTGAREYNPDFLAVDSDKIHWVIEVKSDKDMSSADVQGKREAAKRWSNYVSADPKDDTIWRYVLASESDIKTAKGSWAALRTLAA